MLPNSDFSKQNESWTGGFGSGWGATQDDAGKSYTGVEAWNRTGDMYQTLENMKPGYYLVGINGAFRPSNNRYSTNYAAGVYANDIFNYFPTVIEDMVPVDEAEDGVNCNLTIKSAYDLAIYDDNLSTSEEQAEANGAELLGYAVHGETGMAIAAKAGRYQAYTIAYVGEDGKLTVGIKNPGTQYSSDWTGWGPLTLTYCGDAADDALSTVLENMSARAQTLIDYIWDEDATDPAAGPNFPASMKEELQTALDAVAGAATVEDKAALVATFSDIFQRIYEGKQAYIAMYNKATLLELLSSTGNLAYVEKDEESGEWFETGDCVLDNSLDAIDDACDAIYRAYGEGSYSLEEALNPAVLDVPELKDLLPAQDEKGYYLIGTVNQFVAYRAIASDIDKYAKGKLIADIDMTGIAMLPIGHNRGESAQHIFAGEFDGQGHALANVYIDGHRQHHLRIGTNSNQAGGR